MKKPEDNGVLFDWFYFTEELPGKDKPGYAEIKKQYEKLYTADVPTTPVMMDNPFDMHRASYVFERGNWLVKGNKVEPDVPHSLTPLPADAPRNRLGLAMWLTSKQNPLTARTMVNRVWEQLFGTGLAETLEDLGSQGVLPTHPELLDWLSYQFMNEDNWSVKKLIRRIVMSATYQQESKITPDVAAKRSIQQILCARCQGALIGRAGARSGTLYQRRIMRFDVWPQCVSLAAKGHLALSLEQQGLGTKQGQTTIPARVVHILETFIRLSVHDHIRRRIQGSVHGSPHPHEYTAAGARHIE